MHDILFPCLKGTGNTAAHFCVTYGYAEIGALIKAAGADMSIKNDAGRLPHEGIE